MNGLVEAVKFRLEQLEMSQRLPSETILNSQFEQLALLLEHSYHESPYFKHRLKMAGLTVAKISTKEGFKELPLLSRRHIQEASESLFCMKTPINHGSVLKTQTSGSTGEPVIIRKTGLNGLNWSACNLQDHLWHQRDFTKRLCAIRPHIKAYTKQESWGPPAHLLFKTGSSLALPTTTDIHQLAEWIHEFEPDNLIIYPSTLKELREYCAKHEILFKGLNHIRTVGETVSLENRQLTESYFKAKVEDIYSSQEIGVIAIECPVSRLYHVSSENLIVEILNDAGEPCKPKETGRVVITDLHNFATPLIRYEIGDYAEVGEKCPCGRGSQTIKKILGRERNLIKLPNGKKHWPLTGFGHFREIAPIQQYQLIQEDFETIEVRLVVARSLTNEEESKLSIIIQNALNHPFKINLKYFENRIPVSNNGKFEEFICRIK